MTTCGKITFIFNLAAEDFWQYLMHVSQYRTINFHMYYQVMFMLYFTLTMRTRILWFFTTFYKKMAPQRILAAVIFPTLRTHKCIGSHLCPWTVTGCLIKNFLYNIWFTFTAYSWSPWGFRLTPYLFIMQYGNQIWKWWNKHRQYMW
jgi:hypothetical protein